MKKKILVHFFGQHDHLIKALNGYHIFGNHWVSFWPQVVESLDRLGIELIVDQAGHTFEDINVLWILDLPRKYSELLELLNRYDKCIKVFHHIESPLAHPARLNPSNFDWANGLISYDLKFLDQCSQRRHRNTLLQPLTLELHRPRDHKNNWRHRLSLTMINSNYSYGIWQQRKPGGLSGLPVINWWASGYRIRAKDVHELLTSELYSKRKQLALTASRIAAKQNVSHNDKSQLNGHHLLDIYGSNWSGEPTSWIHKFFKPRPFGGAKGRVNSDKLDILTHYRFAIAFENYRGSRGYISEKILDPILSGCVRIYLGDQDVAQHIPEDAYIDMRNFKNCHQLLNYISSIKEHEWKDRQAAGTEFLKSENASRFSSQSAARRVSLFLSQLLVQ